MPLKGKVILITGGGRGIGRACALAASALGGAVVVNDVDEDEARIVASAILDSGGAALPLGADISTWKGSSQAIQACIDTFDRIDGLVNNAALFQPAGFKDHDEAVWRRMIDVNVLGVAYLMTHAAQHMTRQRSGSIVNMTSGAHQGVAGLAAYGTSKGAVASLTYCASLDLIGDGIRVNAVSPFAATRMVAAASKFDSSQGGLDLGPLPSPEHNAAIVCYLLSDQARHIHGQVIRVERDGLSVLGHPVVLTPYPKFDTTDYAAVQQIFQTYLRDRQQPLGVRYGKLMLE